MRAATIALWGIGCVWVAYAALAASAGLYTMDELFYVGATDAFSRFGSLTIANGYEQFGSEALRLWFLMPGPNGLVPQYPSGYMILATPFYALAGPRGMMVLSALAAVATLFLCHRLALRLYGDRQLALRAALILGFASFLVDYALGLWPHAMSALVVTAAAYFMAGVASEEARSATRDGLFAGVVIGLGIHVRVDVVLMAPALAYWAVIFAPRPLRALVALALGAIPGLAAATAMNLVKFGVAFPISYGAERDGGIDPVNHLVPVLAALAAFAVCLLLRRAEWRAPLRRFWPLVVIAVAALALLISPLRRELFDVARGFYVLVVDLDAHRVGDPLWGIERDEGGTLVFYGLIKKALAQSLPWLGILVVLVAPILRGERRAQTAFLVFLVAVWILPFARTEWHGGIANNLRYFLPLTPFLAILAADAWREIAATPPPSRRLRLLVAAALAVLIGVALVVAVTQGETAFVYLQRSAPKLLFLAIIICAAIHVAATHFDWTPGLRGIVAQSTKLLLWVALVLSCLSAYVFDIAVNQGRRSLAEQVEGELRALPGHSLVVANFFEGFLFQLQRDDGYLAFPSRPHREVDHDLIRDALAADLRVVIQSEMLLERALAGNPELKAVEISDSLTALAVWEVVLATDQGGS